MVQLYTKIILFCFCLILSACYTDSALKKNNADLHHQVAIGHMQKGNYPQALTELLKANELAPKDPAIHNNLGLIYFLREKYDSSEEHFKTALLLRPSFTEARTNYARLLIDLKRYDEAEKNLQVAEEDLTYGAFTKIYNNFGYLYFLQNRYLEAQGYLKKTLQQNKSDCFAIYYYGLSSFHINKFSSSSSALDQYIKSCDLIPRDEPYYFSALSHYRLKNKSVALERFDELLKKYPNGKYNEKARKMADLIRKGY